MLWQVAAMRESRNELKVSCFWKANKFGQNFHQPLMPLRLKGRLGYFFSPSVTVDLGQACYRCLTSLLMIRFKECCQYSYSYSLIPFLLDKILLNSPFPAFLCTSEGPFAACGSVKLSILSHLIVNLNVWYTLAHSTECPQWPFIFLTTITANKKSTRSKEQWRSSLSWHKHK